MNLSPIHIQPTNNPAILKFEANHFLLKDGHYEYGNIDEAKNSPLAQELFYLPFVKTVYLSGNFVAIEKYDIVAWEEVQEGLAERIAEYLRSGQPVVVEGVSKKIPVTVYSESTPNPAVMKFVANRRLVSSPISFRNEGDAMNAPLAQALFKLGFVKEVFMDENYIAVTKQEGADWSAVTMELREFISDFLRMGGEVVSTGFLAGSIYPSTPVARDGEQLDETSLQIIALLDEYVKPAVASDGGHIAFDSYDADAKRVTVVLEGACSGCPSSTYTLKNGIETMLKSMLPAKVAEVIAING